MARKIRPNSRAVSITPNFDINKLRGHVMAASAAKMPTQAELFGAYDIQDVVEIAVAFPNEIDEIVEGIVAQDSRFKGEGKRLLAQLLRERAGSPRKRSQRSRRDASAAKNEPSGTPPRQGSSGIGGESQEPAQSAGLSTGGLSQSEIDRIYSDSSPERYGG